MIKTGPIRKYADFLSVLRRKTDLLNDDPIQEEIFSIERLEQYAAYLANELKVSSDPKRGRSLLSEVKQSGLKLLSAYLSLADAIRSKQVVSPAAEWFVDNFHIIEDQLRGIKQDLPANYYYELPKLELGELKGYPRVYAMALALIAHTDSRLDENSLRRFIQAFQKVAPLRIGELWAVPITLRIALIEHLEPLAIAIVNARQKREQADAFADEFLALAILPDTDSSQLIRLLSRELGASDQFDRGYIVQLAQRLRDQDPDVGAAVDWLEVQLETQKTSIQQVIQFEHHRQAAAQLTVGNIISSMRFLSAMDWRKFFESVNLVDPILCKDPAGAYLKMDFSTRDRYRHTIERIAKRSQLNELDIARKSIELAELASDGKNAKNANQKSHSHIGYYLIGGGLLEFEKSLQYRYRLSEIFYGLVLQNSACVFFGLLFFISILLMLPVIHYALISGGDSWGVLGCILLAAVPASELAVSLLNYTITLIIQPKPLPKMNTELGIPEGARTMVVVPTLFTQESGVRELLKSLHINYLANQDPAIYFALLGDFGDSDSETTTEDLTLLEIAKLGINELNTRYCPDSEARFYLFHRRRQWNQSQKKWMGWERKRGKIEEFNRLLRGAKDTSYSVAKASSGFLSSIQYVITLDSDSQLPRDSAHHLIGTILHPLNQPHFDPLLGRVTEGYGILQPRISVDLVSSRRSRFARLFSGNTGIDPYTTAVSDVYQDLFLEGSFTGKGLYVVDAFQAALVGRVPLNRLLSHDLFEGSFARSALVTDVELFDDYPSDFNTFSKRQHRWTRGDWQIARWLFPRVPNAEKCLVPNQLTLISRWKIFDNLRRSLVAPMLFLWLVLAWTILPGSPLLWTSLVLGMLTFPIYALLTKTILFRRKGITWSGYIRNAWNETQIQVGQIFIMVTFLADQAWSQTDAIVRTLYRILISKKDLLEWVTFSQIQKSQIQENQNQKKFTFSLETLISPGPVLSGVVSVLIFLLHPETFMIAAPFLFCWLINPFLKPWLSRKTPSRARPLGLEQILNFRTYARRTWHYFERFVSQEDHWLAPDNFQNDPYPIIAHRTSPTNIGLQLLSAVSAFDLGYIGLLELTERLENIFSTLAKMARFNGHFFNWYDTKTLEPLRPQYVSTVDSGNLAGHLVTLKQACLDISKRAHSSSSIHLLLIHSQARAGLLDTLRQLKRNGDLVENVAESSGAFTLKHLQEAFDTALNLAESGKWETLSDWDVFLKSLLASLVDVEDILNALGAESSPSKFEATRVWMVASLHLVREFQRDIVLAPVSEGDDIRISAVQIRFCRLAASCDKLIFEMDFNFLFNQERKLFEIGYNVTDGRHDSSFYDLLASESRLTSFLAIAKGDVPQEHWFRLGRQLTPVRGGRALISWSASMFEYLMPLLIMRRYADTLLDETYDSVIARQIEYGKHRGVPWGISEAGFNARDLQLNYQYGPFGIPGLGLKRGLSDELVVSPYSTMLAAMVDPWASLANLQILEEKGAFSQYGFCESIDYTPERLPKNQKSVILQSFMAHHQGMSLVALNNLLNKNIMQKRFHSEPFVQATQLLLQERVPNAAAITQPRAEEVHFEESLRFSNSPNLRIYRDVDLPTPRTLLLSNGTYSVMMTSTGSGYSRCGELAISRWREDVTRDHWGHFFYIRNRGEAGVWSAGYQPTLVKPKKYEVTFAEDKIEFLRQDGEVTTHTEIIVSPEDNVELRRISLTNCSNEACEIEITSFMETVLASPADDAAHPAFSNLFVQTEFLPDEGALLATRRRRSQVESQVWGFHVLLAEGEAIGSLQYETDRLRFVGRGRNLSDPIAMSQDRPLSNTVGSVLDPIFSLRQAVYIPPGKTVRVTFATGMTDSREAALRLVDKYHDIHIFDREMDIAWTMSQVQLRHLNIGSDLAHIFQRLAGRVIFSDPSLRPRSHSLALNTQAQSSLWAYGISGDLPIILTSISDEKDMAMVRILLHGHEYLRLKGLIIDLVILNERAPSYFQSLQDELQRQIRMSGSQALLDRPGGIFVRRTDIIPPQDVILLKTVARVILSAEKGTLEEQLRRRPLMDELPREIPRTSGIQKNLYSEFSPSVPELSFFNGLGGFSEGGRNYVIVLKEDQWTPAPWINVVANEKDFGFLVSEAGSGYTWSINSRENRLTPWSNDPVSDPVGEALYIRDEETGQFWTPTPLPIRESETYVINHGQGFSQFNHNSHGIAQELHISVPLDSSIKISRLSLKNLTDKVRFLSVTSYIEWVLGVSRSASAPFVITDIDPDTEAVFARNPYNNEFAHRIAFSDLHETVTIRDADVSNRKHRTYTCDRKEFLGRNGSPANPAALRRFELSGNYGAGLDPCASFQLKFELAPGETREFVNLLGEAENVEEARILTSTYRNTAQMNAEFTRVLDYWDETLGVIEIKTPDPAMNTIVNRWLLYQTLSCRIWARSAFYQSGGAYGFRDQLQDVMSMVYAKPKIARDQILRAAARQFKEGDVQHWWHPPTGRGVRTRFSDDLLWLPFVVSFYVNVTGDRTILTEIVPFIEAPILKVGEDDSYRQPEVSLEKGTILEHCIRTLDRSLKVGSHGLPLMGSGDWNDGMNRVGNQGQGESVWVGWFLYSTLHQFYPFCEASEEMPDIKAKAPVYKMHMNSLKKAIEEKAWDGDWYRRAYFDDGTPLGSATNAECRIDSIAQSWAVLSGGGELQRATRAMAAVDEYLVHRGDSLVKLFTPPFDQSPVDPGYIKGYLPGVRENGGQYTHAAIWTLMAFAKLGDGDRAAEIYALLNPINHTLNRVGLHKYKVEPYVVAADVYGLFPHVGRGGWTWYTGSSSWMYRAALESILGFELRGDVLRITPQIPKVWPGFEFIYRRGRSIFRILVKNREDHGPAREAVIELDGVKLNSADIPLTDDGKEHAVCIQL